MSTGGDSPSNTSRLIALSQTLDDLRYVPDSCRRTIVANLTQLGPAVVVASLSASVLYDHWGELVRAIGDGGTKRDADQQYGGQAT